MGSKEMFEVVVGPRKIGNLIADEEMRPVTPSYLEEMVEHRSQLAGFPGGSGHPSQEGSHSTAQMRRR